MIYSKFKCLRNKNFKMKGCYIKGLKSRKSYWINWGKKREQTSQILKKLRSKNRKLRTIELVARSFGGWRNLESEESQSLIGSHMAWREELSWRCLTKKPWRFFDQMPPSIVRELLILLDVNQQQCTWFASNTLTRVIRFVWVLEDKEEDHLSLQVK